MKARLLRDLIVTVPAGTVIDVYPTYSGDGYAHRLKEARLSHDDVSLIVYTHEGVTLAVGQRITVEVSNYAYYGRPTSGKKTYRGYYVKSILGDEDGTLRSLVIGKDKEWGKRVEFTVGRILSLVEVPDGA